MRPLIPPLSVTETNEASETLDRVARSIGRLPTLYRTAAHSPAALRALWSQLENSRRMGLTPRQREAVALRMAQLNACEYGLALETSLGAESGVTSREVASFRRGFADDPKEQAILALVTKIIRDRGHNAAYVVDAALQVGLSFGEIIEVIAS